MYVKLGIVLNQFLPQALYPFAGAILQRAAVDVLERIQTDLRGREVGLTNVQVVNFYTSFFRLIGQRDQFTYG